MKVLEVLVGNLHIYITMKIKINMKSLGWIWSIIFYMGTNKYYPTINLNIFIFTISRLQLSVRIVISSTTVHNLKHEKSGYV